MLELALNPMHSLQSIVLSMAVELMKLKFDVKSSTLFIDDSVQLLEALYLKFNILDGMLRNEYNFMNNDGSCIFEKTEYNFISNINLERNIRIFSLYNPVNKLLYYVVIEKKSEIEPKEGVKQWSFYSRNINKNIYLKKFKEDAAEDELKSKNFLKNTFF